MRNDAHPEPVVLTLLNSASASSPRIDACGYDPGTRQLCPPATKGAMACLMTWNGSFRRSKATPDVAASLAASQQRVLR